MPLSADPTRVVKRLLAGVAVATVLAIAVLWPGDRQELPAALGADSEVAEVERVTEEPCPGATDAAAAGCVTADVRLESGPDAGETEAVPLGDSGLAPDLAVGDRIRVQKSDVGTPVPAGAVAPEATYGFVDFERRAPLLWLALAFAVLVVAFGRLRGALSLVGLALSLLVVLGFVVPAILAGEAPFAVAVAGSLAVMLVTIPLAHGLGRKSLAAMLGTTLALVLTALLALAFTELATLTGFSYDEALTLRSAGIEISFEGLLLAGMVIGALGVLDDVTVSQASTTFALRRATPGASFGELFGRALDVGRDHVSATVNTLVLAYVGAALPVLLIFGSSDISIANAINLEVVAREIVAMLVGSIGLIAAVPITTALAAWLAGHAGAPPVAEPVPQRPAAGPR